MTRRPPRQFILELRSRESLPLVMQGSPELVQALADLLLEALGGQVDDEVQADGGRDADEDHA
jgi:hypothetical protein